MTDTPTTEVPSTELDTIATEPKTTRLTEIRATGRGVELATLADFWTFAQSICRAGMQPYLGKNTWMTPAQVMISMQLGAEVGLPPMTALKNIAIINNRPTIWGDALLALGFRKGLIANIDEDIRGEGDQRTAFCTIERTGMTNPVVRTFSVANAKTAGLWGKTGPWQTYPDRMLSMRARAFALRDAIPDALGGFVLAEEAQDLQPEDEPEVITRSEALLRELNESDPKVAARLKAGIDSAVSEGYLNDATDAEHEPVPTAQEAEAAAKEVLNTPSDTDESSTR